MPALRASRVSHRASVRLGHFASAGPFGMERIVSMRRLKILTWHTHGSYLYYLTQAPHDFYVLSKPGRPPGYGGVCGHVPWGANVHDLPVSEAKNQSLDCILFQDDAQYLNDQHEFL